MSAAASGRARWSTSSDPALFSALPSVGSSLLAAGDLRPELAARWGLKPGVKVSAGGGDNMMGALGTANVKAGRVTASLGTSGTSTPVPTAPSSIRRGRSPPSATAPTDGSRFLCTMNVTGVTEARPIPLRLGSRRLERGHFPNRPRRDGLLFLPYLQGERTPNLPSGTGVLHGMTSSNTTPGHIARAMMEGATLGLAYGLERLRALGVAPTEIRLTGGGSKSASGGSSAPTSFATPVATMESAEGAALGAAIQAASLVTGEALPRRVGAAGPGECRGNPRPGMAFDYRPLLKRHTALTRALASQASFDGVGRPSET